MFCVCGCVFSFSFFFWVGEVVGRWLEIQLRVSTSWFKWNFKSIGCEAVGKVEESLNYNWAVAWDFQQFGMCDQQRLRPACAYTQTDQSPCWSLKYSLTVKLLTQPHMRFLSLKGGCKGSSESALVKILHCWKSRVMAQLLLHFGSPNFNNMHLLLFQLVPSLQESTEMMKILTWWEQWL